jgi:hypothetical protein
MARKFGTNVDLLQNELQNAVVQNLASAPGSPREGQFYFDSTAADKRVYVWNGSAWEQMRRPGAGDGLRDNGDAIDLNVGTGLELSSDTIRIAAAAAGNGLRGGAGSALEVNPGTGLEIDSDTVRIAAAAAGDGLRGGGGSALDVNVGTGLELSSDAVRIAAAAAGNGLTGGAGSALAVGAGTGIRVNANDIEIDATVVATQANLTDAIEGRDTKQSARVATTANIAIATALNSGDRIDDITLADGDRVLVKDQTDKRENGIYVVGASPRRSADADEDADVTAAMFIWVEEGTDNEDTGWQLITDNPITLETTELEFTQSGGSASITAGDGLTQTGSTINAVGTADRISVAADAIDIASSYVGQTSLTTLGTIATGRWEATDVGVAHGGTGASTEAAARENLGGGATTPLTRRFSDQYGDNSATSFVISHNLDTKFVQVSVYKVSTDEQWEVDVVRTDDDRVTLTHAIAPTTDEFEVVIVG